MARCVLIASINSKMVAKHSHKRTIHSTEGGRRHAAETALKAGSCEARGQFEDAARQPIEPDPARTGGGMVTAMTSAEACQTVSKHLSSEEELLWFAAPGMRQYLISVFAGIFFIYAIVKFFYFETNIVFFGAFPTIEGNSALNTLLALFLAICLMSSLVSRWRRLRKAGHTAYGLTNKRLIVVAGENVESHGRESMGFLHRIRPLGGDLILSFQPRPDGVRLANIRLSGVPEPVRVSCLIRCTLAHDFDGAGIERNSRRDWLS